MTTTARVLATFACALLVATLTGCGDGAAPDQRVSNVARAVDSIPLGMHREDAVKQLREAGFFEVGYDAASRTVFAKRAEPASGGPFVKAYRLLELRFSEADTLIEIKISLGLTGP